VEAVAADEEEEEEGPERSPVTPAKLSPTAPPLPTLLFANHITTVLVEETVVAVAVAEKEEEEEEEGIEAIEGFAIFGGGGVECV
jgi:hypothetical protein